MPEGDTVHKVCQIIALDLAGKEARLTYLRGLNFSDLKSFQNVEVKAVKALGKHLLVDFANGWTLRVHLGMHGSWNRFPSGPQRPRRDTGVILEGPQTVLVCEGPKDAELFETRQCRRHPILSKLGPDLLGAEVDYEEVMRRTRRCFPEMPLADLLVEQKVACALGNVYRNELCFLGCWQGSLCKPAQGHHPYRPWRSLGDEEIEGIFRRGRELLLANMGGWPRTTTFDARRPGTPAANANADRLWVYGRRGQPCKVCGSLIDSAHRGDFARATAWCPRCQPLIRQ